MPVEISILHRLASNERSPPNPDSWSSAIRIRFDTEAPPDRLFEQFARREGCRRIVLDILLPGRNGLDLCRDIRVVGLRTPILMLTARTEISDKVVGLKLGADDYLTKPFDMLELLARVEALLRRASVQSGRPVYQVGSIPVEARTTADAA